MKLTFVEWPTGLEAGGAAWQDLAARVAHEQPDLLVTNEMPFGPWLAAHGSFDAALAARSIALHEAGLAALHALQLPQLISSRPLSAAGRLVNEAFALEGGRYRRLHQKHFFPEEEGWYERSWFGNAVPGFELAEIGGLRVGVLLCTELMFNERARAYGLAGADLIVVPRATGQSMTGWHAGCAMAAIVSGAYVVSSNRAGAEPGGPLFGGGGLAYGPDGKLIAQTSAAEPALSIAIDAGWPARQKREYPGYVFAGLPATD